MDEITILYPSPPPYYKAFTKSNVNRIKELSKTHPSHEQLRELDEVKNSSSLKYLVPPETPEHEQPVYHSFGNVWQFKDKFMNLKDAGILQLYPDSSTANGGEDEEEDVFTVERIEELKKMTKSLLLNFLELIGLIVKNPYYVNDKIEQIRIILVNLHHLLNSYRLHQSREDLILKIEDKIGTTLKEVDEINGTVESIEQKFKDMLKKIDAVESGLPGDDSTVQEQQQQSQGPVDNNESTNRIQAKEKLIQQILEE